MCSELARATRDVDRPREDEPGDRAQVGHHPGVEEALVDRDAVDPRLAEAAQQAPELATAPDRGEAPDGKPVEGVEQLATMRAHTVKRRPGTYGSSSARTISARRALDPLRSSISSVVPELERGARRG